MVALGIVGVEQPLELGRRHVRRQPQTLGLEQQAVDDGSEVLPPDAGADGLGGLGIPDHGRGSLVGDADAADRTAVGERRAGGGEHCLLDCVGVELDLAWVGR